ncbi:hypothetical protein MettiDRAFT_1277 [Methanolobus tindarius DSM 2278]|uniref:Uncharacterized protein n=1 Tax=Methanolobus tindarius DSM 2278 TaxID=1090322 RepID=W9DWM9_METTI|nr:hypothetical protein [Methanolobus tindarius]ETA67841.1 hypothetical protein MettiDRAFT_1277 [Methanolobus tindarius DSM 2278]
MSMQEINIYFEKIEKNILQSSDIPLILKVLRQDAKNGLIELSKDDIHLFQVYMFFFQQLELAKNSASSDVHAGDWRQTVDDLSLLKQVMDEMEKRKIVTTVSWNAGGMAIFDIPDEIIYKNHFYYMLLAHLNKIYGRK